MLVELHSETSSEGVILSLLFIRRKER